ncbi:hypothetical protein B0H14DRAFT_3636759 [Mycena olivaceomarginata]|nr:hypothetical protein B0H14DRAFT_3636759 [Mycena olivaceomarginata]
MWGASLEAECELPCELGKPPTPYPSVPERGRAQRTRLNVRACLRRGNHLESELYSRCLLWNGLRNHRTRENLYKWMRYIYYPGNINAENFYKDHGSPDAEYRLLVVQDPRKFGTPLPNLYHLLHQIRCENGLKIREGRISATGQTLLRKGRFEFVIWVVAPALGEHPTLERLEFLWSRSGSYFSFGFYRPDFSFDQRTYVDFWAKLDMAGTPRSSNIDVPQNAIALRSDLHEQFDQYEFGFEQGLNLIPIRRELVLSAIAFAFLRKPALQGFRET